MSKFLLQKKKLIEDVFEKASNETTESSFSGILKALERSLCDDFRITLSYKTFETYYNVLVIDDRDYNIKPVILDDLSIYLGYNNFKEYCLEWKTVEHSARESMSNIVINIINKPLLKIPEFMTKQSGLGLVGILLIGGLFLGKNFFQDGKDDPDQKAKIQSVGFTNVSFRKNSDSLNRDVAQNKDSEIRQVVKVIKRDVEKPVAQLEHYMYWNGERFIKTTESYLGSEFKVIPINENQINYFRKITTPDSLTSSSLGKVWYSKHKNVVEFFTSDGVNPDNGKELKPLTQYILDKYVQ